MKVKQSPRGYILLLTIVVAVFGYLVYKNYSPKHQLTDSPTQANITSGGDFKTYTSDTYGFTMVFPKNQNAKYLNFVTEKVYDSTNPYNPIGGVIFCADEGLEQCGDGILVTIFEKSKCDLKSLDATSKSWCEMHKNSTNIGKWIPTFEGAVVESLWFGSQKYLYEFMPTDDAAKAFLDVAKISVSK